MPLAASRPPSFMKKRRVRGKCFFLLAARHACASVRIFEADSDRGQFAAEDFDGGAGHVDVVVGFVPFDLQVAAEQVDRDAAIGAAGQDAGDADGTGAGAAGERLAGAALPGALPHRRRG